MVIEKHTRERKGSGKGRSNSVSTSGTKYDKRTDASLFPLTA